MLMVKYEYLTGPNGRVRLVCTPYEGIYTPDWLHGTGGQWNSAVRSKANF